MKIDHKLKVLVICLCVLAMLSACGGQGSGDPSVKPVDNAIRNCTFTVTNEVGTPIEWLTVVVYEDATCSKTVAQSVTNAEGKISFTHAGPVESCVAVIQKASNGYAVEKTYPITGENTTVTLKAGAPLTQEHLNTDKRLLTLGDPMLDFEVTAADGTVFSLSKALDSYDAVVLNFWYMQCNPCKLEFPHLQEAYESFEGKVAVIAMNPYDSDNPSIESFRQEKGYTFLMGKCDEGWAKIFDIPSYPVTVVIDRFGYICLVHNGSVDSPQTFENVFGFFTADDYQQTFFRSINELPHNES